MNEAVIDTAAIALVDGLLAERDPRKKRLAEFVALQSNALAAEQELETLRRAYGAHERAVIAELAVEAKAVEDFREIVEQRESDLNNLSAFLTVHEEDWRGLGLPTEIPILDRDFDGDNETGVADVS